MNNCNSDSTVDPNRVAGPHPVTYSYSVPDYNYGILPNIFGNIFAPRDYNDILNDTSINGKFKYLINYNPANNHGDPGSILLHFLMQYSPDNKLFGYNIRPCPPSHFGGARGKKQRRKNAVNNHVMRLRLPAVPYKNLECNYNGHTLWVSNIFTSKYLPEQSTLPPCIMVLSIDTGEDTHDEWIKTNWMADLMKESKIWHMKNVLGDDYNPDNYTEIFTYNDGFWELKKANRKRDKKTLFISESFYDKLITKINRFSLDTTKEIYERLNLPYKLNILLHGPPGTGKTSFIEIMAAELKRDIRFMQITPKITDEQFSSAISKLGCDDILVCEDIDCLFMDRKESDGAKNAMTFSGLLNCFDGINGGKNGLIVFLTTNYKCRLDNALTRPGRVDLLQEFKYMSKDTVYNMVKFYFAEHFNQDDFDKLYGFIQDFNITGAIMSQFLLGLLLDETYELYKNRKILTGILDDNSYEDQSSIEKSLYT
jgi:hypothetical protein